jgi:DNA-binding CsgD family transcriptional regulator
VAERLHCSKGSAAAHLSRARARLLATTTEHAVALALGMGLFEAPLRLGTEGKFIARSLLRPRKRESEVLVLLAKGLSNAEIGKEMGIGVDTVKDQVEDLREMYGARNRTHLIALAFAVGTLRFVSSRHISEARAA